jgi:hypothetical protein
MAAYTNLDYVQTILSSLDSDEVNSISDTVESLQVANIVKTVYNDMQSRMELPEHKTLFELNASGDSVLPVIMYRPSDAIGIDWIQYDKMLSTETDPNYQEVQFMPIGQFLVMTNSMNTDETEVLELTLTLGSDNVNFKYRNDRAPSYYTTFNDSTIVFDSFDSGVDTTLQKTKTRCYGKKDQSFQMTDVFTPFLDRDLSTLLLNEAKVLAFAELKQTQHAIAGQWARRGWVKSQKSKRAIDIQSDFDRLPSFGRK